ncbi:MAG: hypothetical protein RL885_11160 [Planctomycetota bacterium]
MNRGVWISIIVLLAIIGLVIALTQSIESSEQRTLERLDAKLTPIAADIEALADDTGRLVTRLPAAAQSMIQNVQALRQRQSSLQAPLDELRAQDEPDRNAIRALEDQVEQHRTQVAKHRDYISQLVEATSLAAEAQAPAETLMGRVQTTLKEDQGKLSPQVYSRFVTRLTSLQGRYDTYRRLIEQGLKELYASPGSEPGWVQVKTGAKGLEDLRPPIEELLAEIENG